MNPYERQRKTIHKQEQMIVELQRRLDVCRKMNDMLFNQNLELSTYIKEMERINGTTKKDTG